ncbi:MAG: valine--tRNA ligase [Phycisphaerales bacterium]|nr:MAG: valine--tRNA ligase [Phycisphaerales bacterium]
MRANRASGRAQGCGWSIMRGSMIKTELAKSYTPAETEDIVRAKWDEAGAFHAEAGPAAESARAGKPYAIMIPPPNVTAALHLGHAFNNTLQDVLARAHRMKGFNTLWMPGTDHAGIATQTVVDKRLQHLGEPSLKNYKEREAEGGRDAFIAKVQQWKDEYEATILDQLKAMGCSCDYDRTRFTMDEVCAKAVREAFSRLFKDGLIYRGKRLVNWDPVTQTALADDEVEMQEVDGHFWYLRYPLVHPSENPSDPMDCQEVTWSELAARGYPGAGKRPDEEVAWVTVATTRPETYLGDTAVAVNPDDPRAKPLRGLMAQLPLVGRVIPIIEDDYVVMPDPNASDPKAQYASGFLKVTPAHDPNDYEIGERHNLDKINVMAPDASISDKHGWEDIGDAHLFVGKSREEARKLVVKEFEARNLLEAVKAYRHSVGHSYRSHVPIEPYLSDQWYVKVTDDRLKGEALRAMSRDQFDGEPPAREQIAPGLPGTGAGSNDDGGRSSTPAKAGAKCEGDAELRFFPARYAKTFQQWHENLRDWCISRQLWWGHRIPVWHKRVTLTAENWTDELLKWGWDSYVEGNWEDDGIVVRIVRTSDGSVVDPTVDPLMPVTKDTEGEYDIFICMRDEACFLKSQISNLRFQQDPDVLDTWFSSALWPISTLGWPDPDAFPDEIPEGSALLETFNPSSVLCTAREIITLWVSRMVMFNRYFRDHTLPFRHVYIHAMIQDGHGQKMSKSLGNGVDPRDIIQTHGSDALRYVMTQIATATQDVRMPVDLVCPHTEETFTPKMITTPAGYTVPAPIQSCPSDPSKKMVTAYGIASGQAQPTDEMPLAINASQKFDLGRNFANKLWNATRFALSNLETAKDHGSSSVNEKELTLADRWMLSRLHAATQTIDRALDAYQFNVYADTVYDLVWREFCDWYLEAIKPTIRESPTQQQVLRTILNAIIRLLHPIMPFVTETLWPHVSDAGPAGLPGVELPSGELCCTVGWPRIEARWNDEAAEAIFRRAQQLVEDIRRIRGERNIPFKQKLTLMADEDIRKLAQEAGGMVEVLAGLAEIQPMGDRPADAVPITFEGREILLTGLYAGANEADREAEMTRLAKVIAEKERAAGQLAGRLSNENYVKKAPAHLVEETKQKLEEAKADLEAAQQALAALKQSAN